MIITIVEVALVMVAFYITNTIVDGVATMYLWFVIIFGNLSAITGWGMFLLRDHPMMKDDETLVKAAKEMTKDYLHVCIRVLCLLAWSMMGFHLAFFGIAIILFQHIGWMKAEPHYRREE